MFERINIKVTRTKPDKPMLTTSRRKFLLRVQGVLLSLIPLRAFYAIRKNIMAVKGPMNAEAMGITLPQEHILVDFIGAKEYDRNRWNLGEAVKKVLPYLKEVME